MNVHYVLSRWHLGQETAVEVEPSTTAETPSESSNLPHFVFGIFVLALMYTMCVASGLIIPMVLAAFIATCIGPLVNVLDRVLPRVLAVLIILGLLATALYVALSTLWLPAREWLDDAPRALPQLAAKLSLLARAAADLSGASALESAGMIATGPDMATSFSWWTALSEAPTWVAQGFSVVLLTFFFSWHGGELLRRLVELSPTLTQKKKVVGIVRAIQLDTSRYFLITTCINILLGAATAIAMWALGVREPLMWGAMVALFNFVPYVGAMTSAVILALVGILQFDTIGHGLTPALVFLALATIEGQFIGPTVLGQRLSLSPVAILLWLMLWGWMWGIAGVLLGVPMLMCLKLICERLPHWRWLARALE